MDTRHKILTGKEAAKGIGRRERLRLVIGHFDPLYAAHAVRLRALRDGTLTAVVLTDPDNPICSQRARAEVVAGLASVDYVVITDGASVESVIATLEPTEIVDETAADVERTRALIEHVHARQSAQ